MTLTNLCTLFDSYNIVDKQTQVSNTFYASSEFIHSDGLVHSHIEKHGYIEITNVENAYYIMFVDQNGDLFLNIYKYTPETMYKEIIDNMNKIRAATGIHRHVDTSLSNDVYNDDDTSDDDGNGTAEKEDIDLPASVRSKYVDLNTFTCPECKEKISYHKIKDSDVVIGTCKKCNTEYTLVPSKYYVLRAKKIIYKNVPGSRHVKFE
jgi:ribosomal protein L37AE/L43A